MKSIDRDKMEQELEKLSDLAFRFADAMREKLWKKYDEGFRGWDDDSDSSALDELRRKLGVCILKYNNGADPSQLVDIGNLSAMLWNLEVANKK